MRFFRFQTHLSAERNVISRKQFTQNLSLAVIFAATSGSQPLGVSAVAPSNCNHSSETAEPARRQCKPLYCQRHCLRFDAIPAHCSLCSHIDDAKLRNFEMIKLDLLAIFSFCDFDGPKHVGPVQHLPVIT